ncbi:plasmid partitioning protein RepB [Rhizobium sp. RM]|uniref:plasmid partitioning protein RepB n=1 Tax=Rhizobium sp. RM TaxID=2748079 RepID=UPI00110ED2C7|nr:plasmid partitioning protein RepB [Rhizobium sp. RM]NWJ27461.1 plasmid partitioning protein RepB [Rhizobium sp. RM]TMV18582.1 plasmid partitioning protein RepB [Rhizobium sp. Td3]
MARKNLIGVSDESGAVVSSPSPNTSGRPIAGFVPPPRPTGPIGGITKSLSNITSTMERAQGIEKQLAEGQTIIELDPALIDSSFVSDRLALDETKLAELAEQIRENGQQVPILIRPHPEAKGRFQVAYGHRRLAAVRRLQVKVRAVVRDLTDDQLVVSQGQENNSRTNLSYIERALFAAKLEDRSFTREIIMSALGVDKAALSKMLSVVKQVPITLIEAIGAAPEVGRRRWMELADKLDASKVSTILEILKSEEALAATSEDRFQLAFVEAFKKPGKTAANVSAQVNSFAWSPASDNAVRVQFSQTAKKGVLSVEAKDGPKFAEYISSQLESLYAAFRRSEKEKAGD